MCFNLGYAVSEAAAEVAGAAGPHSLDLGLQFVGRFAICIGSPRSLTLCRCKSDSPPRSRSDHGFVGKTALRAESWTPAPCVAVLGTAAIDDLSRSEQLSRQVHPYHEVALQAITECGPRGPLSDRRASCRCESDRCRREGGPCDWADHADSLLRPDLSEDADPIAFVPARGSIAGPWGDSSTTESGAERFLWPAQEGQPSASRLRYDERVCTGRVAQGYKECSDGSWSPSGSVQPTAHDSLLRGLPQMLGRSPRIRRLPLGRLLGGEPPGRKIAQLLSPS